MINVTKSFLPPFDEYTDVLKRAWDKAWITNNGELVQELEHRLKEYLGVKHLFFTTNGTVVLQMALKALDISKEVITTPFSYVATTNTLLWEGCTPVFADIDPVSFCIDPDKIEKLITADTQAILATHVYGIPCNVEAIQRIAKEHKLAVIYDGAHAFGTKYKGKELLSYGDISTCSFHATKLFHTVEGGCVITDNDALARKLMLYRQFGHIGDEYFSVGINAKNSEFHAAMGLVNLRYTPQILQRRKLLSDLYKSELAGTGLQMVVTDETTTAYNHSYFPVVFQTADQCDRTIEALRANEIIPRRYFYPSLSTLDFLTNTQGTPVSDDIAIRVLCLPLFHELREEDVQHIAAIVKKQLVC